MSRLSGLFAAAATFVAAVAFATSVAAPASADPLSGCTTSSGVLVVVDLRPFGGQLARGCDATITTGYDALHAAGFTTDGTHHDGPGFVCRIDSKPTAAQDACFNTPPASAYWSYWHANAGKSTWTFSTLGAQSYQPHPGSIDAWVFGATDSGGTYGGPTFSPAQVRSGSPTSSSPKPSHHSSTVARAPDRHRTSSAPDTANTSRTPASSSSAANSAGSANSASSSRAAASSRAARSSAAASATPTSSRVAAGSRPTSGSAPTIVDASSVADKTKSSGGSVLPVVIGLALALLLGGGAGWTVLRRRRAESADR